jgi:amino acid transporter
MRKYIIALIFIVVIIVFYLLGFRIVYNSELDNNWDAISAIASWIGVIATILIAISVQKYSNKIKPTARYIDYTINKDNPYIVISNTGEKPLIISQISFNYKSNSLGRINCEDYHDIGSVIDDYYIVNPYKLVKIDLPIMLFQSQLAEFKEFIWPDFKNIDNKIKNKRITIKIKSITGDCYVQKIGLTLEQYIDIVNYRG